MLVPAEELLLLLAVEDLLLAVEKLVAGRATAGGVPAGV